MRDSDTCSIGPSEEPCPHGVRRSRYCSECDTRIAAITSAAMDTQRKLDALWVNPTAAADLDSADLLGQFYDQVKAILGLSDHDDSPGR